MSDLVTIMNEKIFPYFSQWRKRFHKSAARFADLCGVHLNTVQRWDHGNAISDENIDSVIKVFRELTGDNSFSVHDLIASPSEYEAGRLENERLLHIVDSDRGHIEHVLNISPVYPLSRIGKTIDHRTRYIGFTTDFQYETNSKNWCNIYIDIDGIDGVPFGAEVALRRIFGGDDFRPQSGDTVLVWDSDNGSRFVKWQDNDDSYESIHGVKISVKI